MTCAPPGDAGDRVAPGGALERRPGLWPWLFAAVLCGEALFFWPGGLDQFLLPKEALLVAGMSLVLAARAAERAVGMTVRASVHVPALIAGFAAWAVIAPVGVSRNLSLHLLGAVELAALVLAAVLALALREDLGATGVRVLFGSAGIAAALVALLTVLQAVGLDPFRAVLGLRPSGEGRWRVLTTLGNPNWTAELLAAALPLALAVLGSLGPTARRRRLVSIGIAVLLAAAVGATGSRGGLVALAAGAAVFWVLAVRASGSAWFVRTAGVAVALLAVGSAVALGAGASRWSSLPPITGRLGLWAAGSRLVAEAPLRGSGLKQIQLVLPGGLEAVVKRVTPGVRRWLPSTLVDRLDNDLLQTAVAGGIPAAVLLLAVYGAAVRRSWRRASAERSGLDAGIAGSLVALGVGSLSSSPLHTPATATLFWIVAGLSFARRDLPPPDAGNPARRGWRFAVALVAASVAVVAVLAAARALEGDAMAGRGHRLVRAGRPAEGIRDVRAGLRKAPWLGAGYGDLALALLETGNPRAALIVIDTGGRWVASERLWALRARAWAGLGRWNDALAQVERGLRVLPSSKVLLAEKARLMRMRR